MHSMGDIGGIYVLVIVCCCNGFYSVFTAILRVSVVMITILSQICYEKRLINTCIVHLD